MKKILCTLLIGLVVLGSLMGCSGRKEAFEFRREDFTVLEEADTHGGFHGDGMYYLMLDCSENREQGIENVKDWKKLPLSENLVLILYGGEKDGITYESTLAEEAHIPVVKNGWFRFFDRHAESTDPADDSALFDRGSFNFSLGIYDSDTDLFYYLEFDT